jgi:hypothetical protein
VGKNKEDTIKKKTFYLCITTCKSFSLGIFSSRTYRQGIKASLAINKNSYSVYFVGWLVGFFFFIFFFKYSYYVAG